MAATRRGATFRTTTRAAAPIAGAKTGCSGICDRECRLCFSVGLWNGRDPILKERLFGVTGPEGNHGEDVKECYYYLDSTPTHSYMKALYKYPQSRYPYEELVEVSRSRDRTEPEFELTDTAAFDESRYFDVTAEYAKASPNDLLIRLTVTNHGPQAAVLHVLPQLFFRNTWTWQCTDEGCTTRPSMRLKDGVVQTYHETLDQFLVRLRFDGLLRRLDLVVHRQRNQHSSPPGLAERVGLFQRCL